MIENDTPEINMEGIEMVQYELSVTNTTATTEELVVTETTSPEQVIEEEVNDQITDTTSSDNIWVDRRTGVRLGYIDPKTSVRMFIGAGRPCPYGYMWAGDECILLNECTDKGNIPLTEQQLEDYYHNIAVGILNIPIRERERIRELRRREYGPIEEQLDMIYHNGLEYWKSHISNVKERNPLPGKR